MPPDKALVEILFVDDDMDNFVILEQRLVRFFAQLRCPVRLTYEAEPDAACNLIATRAQPFQVVIADLLFPQASSRPCAELDSRGIDVVGMARGISRDTVVVAITQGSRDEPELEGSARDAGADIVLLRGHLRSNSRYGGPLALVREIYNLLCERELVEAGPVIDIEDEPGILTVQGDTGKATLRLLLADLLTGLDSEVEHATLSYLTPGRSEAHVVHADVRLAGGRRRSYFVKLSRNRDSLDRELRNAARASGLYGPSLVVPHVWNEHSPAGPRNGWSAIAHMFADTATTLRKWLRSPESAVGIAPLMDQLFFNGGLATGYQRSITDEDEHRRPIDRLTLPPFRRIRLRATVDELAAALGHPDAGAVPDAAAVLEVVERFARTASFGGLSTDETPGGLRLVEAHGDLHGGNILVTGGRRAVPAVIDLATFGQHHWAVDLARLNVDLLLECVDSGVESMLWRRFARWRALATAVGQLAAPPSDQPDPANRAVLAALTWLAENHVKILRPVTADRHRWEWHLALAEQLLRGAGKTRLPHPKRAFALVAAHDQLRSAGDTVPRRGASF